MLDSKLLRENPNIIESMLNRRGVNFPLGELISLDKKRRQLIIELQDCKHRKNVTGSISSPEEKRSKK